MTTEYHSLYYAHQLTRRLSSDNSEKLSQSLLNATVDLNPHQVEAALFAFQSPLSRGAVLADEVGLGKTIEAGLIVSQLWAERKRRILCIVPASLRKQWNRELLEKFFIQSLILETKSFNKIKKENGGNPFDQNGTVVICSYEFAKAKTDDVKKVDWDLVVIDEAHRMRNVYKKSNKIARAIREAIHTRPKVLLTATPLQNSLMELYGLVSVVDPQLFGSEDTFRSQFATKIGSATTAQLDTLKARIRPVCQRTLRRQVIQYVRYTKRTSHTEDFTPTDQEAQLYESVSSYLQKPELIALPSSQRQLITLILRKILASSSFAISATFGTLIGRLEIQQKSIREEDENVVDLLGDDVEHVEELQEEWCDSEDGEERDGQAEVPTEATVLKQIGEEIAELRNYKQLAESIGENAKGTALLSALKVAFRKSEELDSPKKVLIFTESRRTQNYLKELLERNGYTRQIVTFNGTNTDPDSRRIYADWLQQHEGEDCVTGSPTADIRSALIEEFRDRATIMIATESAAEGVNLQFCNLVVNFDLPWNPQRIEQRLGRCHRYGQKHDVVVINFLNRKNEADRRVFQLLRDKFKLFDGVFGASDEVLGTLESGMDFEKRINDIYQKCRTSDEINAAFDALQTEMEENIAAGLSDARQKLLEHFDEEVHRRLRVRSDETRRHIDRYQRWLWELTRIELEGLATFDHDGFSFDLSRRPPGLDLKAAPPGRYRLVTEHSDSVSHQYRMGHPLAVALLEQVKNRSLPIRAVAFDCSSCRPRVTLVERLIGQTGWLRATVLSITALDTEDHLVLSGVTDEGISLDQETCEKLLDIPGQAGGQQTVKEEFVVRLNAEFQTAEDARLAEAAARNLDYFAQESDKLDNWAEDLKENLEHELKEIAARYPVIETGSTISSHTGRQGGFTEACSGCGETADRETQASF